MTAAAADARAAPPWSLGALPVALYVLLLPLLALLGALWTREQGDTTLRNVAYAGIALVPLLLLGMRAPSRRVDLLAVGCCALALLLQNALLSTHLWGWDIQQERYLSALVAESGRWDPDLRHNINSMLGVVLLAPSLSLATGWSVDLVLRLAYPLVFALVPPLVYRAAELQAERAAAVLAAFFFMALFSFSTEMLQLARQQVAEFLLALLFALLVARRLGAPLGHGVLLALLGGLVVAHYGLAYLFLLLLLGVVVLALVPFPPSARAGVLSPSVALLFGVGVFVWYTVTAKGSAFSTVAFSAYTILERLSAGLFQSGSAEALEAVTQEVGPLRDVARALQLASLAVIAIGTLAALRPRAGRRLDADYLRMGLAGMALLAAATIVPNFASALNFSRIYQILLLWLALFFGIGVLALAAGWRRFRKGAGTRGPTLVAATFLGAFLLFNVGAVYDLAGDPPPILARVHPDVDFPIFSDREVAGAAWLVAAREPDAALRADDYRLLLLHASAFPDVRAYRPGGSIAPGDYVFLGERNLRTGEVLLGSLRGEPRPAPYGGALQDASLVYDNGGARALLAEAGA